MTDRTSGHRTSGRRIAAAFASLSVFRFVSVYGNTIVESRRVELTSATFGRGYSTFSNRMYQSCLEEFENDSYLGVDDRSATSDYDQQFYQISGPDYHSDLASGELSLPPDAPSTFWIGKEVDNDAARMASTRNAMYYHYLVSSHRVDRYHHAMNEADYSLTPDARRLLEDGDYVTFVATCGTSYVRSIRRLQEFVTLFKYRTGAPQSSDNFFASLTSAINGIAGGAPSDDPEATLEEQGKGFFSNEYASTLALVSRTFGVDAGGAASASLSMRSMEDYRQLLGNVLQGMTKPGAGMVRSMEVAPYVSFSPFLQTAARKDVESCPDDRCQPVPAVVLQYNMLRNAEFALRVMEDLDRRRSGLRELDRCINGLINIPNKNIILVNRRRALVNYVHTDTQNNAKNIRVEDLFTIRASRLLRLLTQTDRRSRTVMVQRAVMALTAVTRNFHSKCLDALAADSPNILGGAFLTKLYSDMPECKEYHCIYPNYEWDDKKKTCVQTIFTQVPGDDILNEPAFREDDYMSLMDMYCPPVYDQTIGGEIGL